MRARKDQWKVESRVLLLIKLKKDKAASAMS
uniref:Uncharacterized protein n=1 Tax=Rhizophora mucronata TaxID=61149 RepID=A0A2P2R012_RHIMU